MPDEIAMFHRPPHFKHVFAGGYAFVSTAVTDDVVTMEKIVTTLCPGKCTCTF